MELQWKLSIDRYIVYWLCIGKIQAIQYVSAYRGMIQYMVIFFVIFKNANVTDANIGMEKSKSCCQGVSTGVLRQK